MGVDAITGGPFPGVGDFDLEPGMRQAKWWAIDALLGEIGCTAIPSDPCKKLVLNSGKTPLFNGTATEIAHWLNATRAVSIDDKSLRKYLKEIVPAECINPISGGLYPAKASGFVNLVGVKNGEYTVMGFAGERRDENYDRVYSWHCECSCGFSYIKTMGEIVNTKLTHCGCKTPWLYDGFTPTYIAGVKNAAAKRGLKYEVSEGYLWRLLEKQEFTCVFSGVKLVVVSRNWARDYGQHTASLDRIDSSVGYVEGNLQWVHKKVNIMKMAARDEELRHWCGLIAAHTNAAKSTPSQFILI
jgi:hypothetical protein